MSNTTQLLVDARKGDSAAHDTLWPFIYDELRQIARGRLLQYRPSETMNTTALVHETYLKLIDYTQIAREDKAHFFALASRAMRFIIVDYARARTAAKRGGTHVDLHLGTLQIAGPDAAADDLVSLDHSLELLSQYDEGLGRLVEYRFFGGLNYQEIADLTGRSIPSLKRDWNRARTWLYHLMEKSDGDTPQSDDPISE